MSPKRRARIAGTGMYVPEKVIDNKYYENFFDTCDAWIRTRTGIETRRYVEKDVTTSDIGLIAAQRALEKAQVKATDIDLIIMATLSPDYYFPGSGVVIQHGLGLSTTPAVDLRCQCSGFIFALSMGQAYIEAGIYHRILVIGAEVHSKLKDMTPPGRDVSVLFGDGAGAAVLEATTGDSHILSSHLHSQGEFAEKLYIPKPGTKGDTFMTSEDLESGKHYVYMDGRAVFRHATTRFTEVIKEALTANEMSADDVDHFIFHQANTRINEFVAKSLKVPLDKVHSNIQKYGNCSAASIPMLLAECQKLNQFKTGDILCLASFGSGFMWGSLLVRW